MNLRLRQRIEIFDGFAVFFKLNDDFLVGGSEAFVPAHSFQLAAHVARIYAVHFDPEELFDYIENHKSDPSDIGSFKYIR